MFPLGTEINVQTADYACPGKSKGAIVDAEPCLCPGNGAGCQAHPGVACDNRGQKGRLDHL
jgi:hypothetical protein